MRAITLTQPWATLVALGAKTVETRSWGTSYRGRLLIHAAQGFPRDAKALCFLSPWAYCLRRRFSVAPYPPNLLPRKAAVAVADLVNVLPTSDPVVQSRFLESGQNKPPWQWTPDELNAEFGNFEPGRFVWVLANVRRLRAPYPMAGALGLWNVPPHIDVESLLEDERCESPAT